MRETSDAGADELIYRGESVARRTHIARLLAFLSPGVAYWYVGHPIKGVTVNLGFVLLIELFIILLAWLKFFPLLPLLVLALGWMVLCALVAQDVSELIAERGYEDEYLVKGYNHGIAYALVALTTFYAPIAVSWDMTESHLVTGVDVTSAAMYPTLLPGDVVLLDRHGFDVRGVSRGDLVAVSAAAPDAPIYVLRVVAMAGDVVRLSGEDLYLDEEPLDRAPAEIAPAEDEPREKMVAMVERNKEERYVIALSREVFSQESVPPQRLGEQEMFLLADNRSHAPLGDDEGKMRDSRNFGPISVERVRGMPRFVLWSRDLKTGRVRWGRIGIKLQEG